MNPPPADLRCRACGALLGRCTPRELVVCGVRLRAGVTLECLACGARQSWFPRPRRRRPVGR
jgi:hypothetical protein